MVLDPFVTSDISPNRGITHLTGEALAEFIKKVKDLKIEKISDKQLQVLKFPFKHDYKALICDGAVRSGKTVFMVISFLLWAMKNFDKSSFAICGKTVQATERNIVEILNDIQILTEIFTFKYIRSKHVLIVSGLGKTNSFYIFGGKDESSYMLIQGITLSGVFFDEVALQPKSFVEQAIARTLSVSKSKLYFNCNPEHSEHWFYKEWILDADGENKKRSYHLHFLMEDNPILSKEDIDRAKSLYSGVFLDRYIYGIWCFAEGLVYPKFKTPVQFDEYKFRDRFYIQNTADGKKYYGDYYVSIDYGTANPFSAGLWFVTNSFAVRVKEYYYNSKETNRQKTDDEYFKDLLKLIGERPIKSVVVDPSALSFITLLRKKKFNVLKAQNDVTDGIRVTDCFLNSKVLLINQKCKDILREFKLYRWDEKSTDKDKVIKEYDHAMDDMRYFCNTIMKYLPQFSGYERSAVKNEVAKIINKNWY